MSLTRTAKSVIYAVSACLAAAFSVWATVPMYSADEIVAGYLRSVLLLFIAACVIAGAGMYTFLAHTRRHPAHRGDSVFGMVLGGALLVIACVIACRFGGVMTENFDSAALAAVNLNVVLFGILPLPFLVRALWMAAAANGEKRWPALAASAAAIVWYAALIAAGYLFRLVTYEFH